MMLPSTIFQGKNDGDIVKLKYNGELIELTINQNMHGLKFSKGTFKQVFRQQATFITNHRDSEDPCFGIHDPFWGYNLDSNRVIYKLSVNNPHKDTCYPKLQLANPSEFRPKRTPLLSPTCMELSDDEKFIHFTLELVRFMPEDIHIIVNDKFILFYAEFHDRSILEFPIVWDDLTKERSTGSKEYWEEILSSGRELIYPFRWDRSSLFKHFNIEQMKQIVLQSEILFSRGVLSFKLPTIINTGCNPNLSSPSPV